MSYDTSGYPAFLDALVLRIVFKEPTLQDP